MTHHLSAFPTTSTYSMGIMLLINMDHFIPLCLFKWSFFFYVCLLVDSIQEERRTESKRNPERKWTEKYGYNGGAASLLLTFTAVESAKDRRDDTPEMKLRTP